MTSSEQTVSAVTAAANRLLELVQLPDTPAVAAEFAGLLGDLRPFDNRHWSEFTRKAVAAYVLAMTGRPSEALVIALQLAAENADDVLAGHVIQKVRSDLLKHSMQSLHMRRPDMALHGTALLRRILPPSFDMIEEKSLEHLVRWTSAAVERHQAPQEPVRGRPTVIHLGIWGERFVQAADRYFFACCLAPGNVPALAKVGTVLCHIHTRPADIDRIAALDTIQRLREHAIVRIDPLPEPFFLAAHMWGLPFWNRLVLAAAMHDSVLMARAQEADFCSMGADVLMSNRCLSWAKEKLTVGGYGAVAAAPIRATSDIFDHLGANARRAAGALTIEAVTLYESSLHALHPLIQQSFVRRAPNPLPVDPVQFYFPTSSGFACRTTQLHSSMFSTALLPMHFECDFHTFDCRLLSDLVAGRDASKTCYVHLESPGDMFYLGVDEKGTSSEFGGFQLSPAHIAQAARKWINREEDMAYLDWLMRLRFNYPAPKGLELHLPQDCLDEESTVAWILQDLKADGAILDRIRSYRSAA